MVAVSWLSGCALTGHQIVQNRQVVPGGATQTVVVDCPVGKKVLGALHAPMVRDRYTSGSARIGQVGDT